jgi:hypothetical protein
MMYCHYTYDSLSDEEDAMADMSIGELTSILSILGVDQDEAAQLLGIDARTMRRWSSKSEDIPGPAIVALRAWRAMQERQMNWKPDELSLLEDDQDQIAKYRNHIVDLNAALKEVEERGGPKSPWAVDLSKKSAIFGPFQVRFYELKSDKGFSLSSYRRRDQAPDLQRDMHFLQDAAYCYGKAINRAKEAPPRLKKIAEYTRQNSSVFARSGPKVLTPTQKANRQKEIEVLADRIDDLASEVAIGKGGYVQFEEILTKLHLAGFFPVIEDISEVAKVMG